MEEAARWSGVLSTLSTAVGLGNMVQKSPGARRAVMGSRRAGTLFGVEVASAAGPAKIMRILAVKTAQRFDGGDGFCGVYTRCSPRVCYSRCALSFRQEGVLGYAIVHGP